MNLTSVQKTTLATHINANTNAGVIPGSGGQTFVINTAVSGRDPTLQQGIADWYNGAALAGDNQAFANLLLWNPVATVAQLNSAVNHPDTPVHGLGGSPTVDQQLLAIGNQWWRWNDAKGSGFIDMTDAQVRLMVTSVWGNPSTTATNVGNTTCGKIAGRRIDLVLSPAPVGGSLGLGGPAHICPRGANNVPILSSMNGPTVVPAQTLTANDIDAALFPNG